MRSASADLVVGIPSFNNARTIGHVARAASAGLAKYFPGRQAVLVNSDGGSTDGTPDGGGGRGGGLAPHHPGRPRALARAQGPDAVPRHPGQGQRLPHHLRHRASGWRPRPARWWTPTCAASPRPGWSCCSAPCSCTGSTTCRPSTCATSTTAPSPTPSSIRSRAPSTARTCASPSAATSASPGAWPPTT